MFHELGSNDAAALEYLRETNESQISRGLAEGFYVGWLAETAEGQIVASGGIYLFSGPPHARGAQPRCGEIVNVYTEPAHRRRGLARQLMLAMIDWCRASGVRTIILHASGQGQRLYESLGFKPTNELSLRLP